MSNLVPEEFKKFKFDKNSFQIPLLGLMCQKKDFLQLCSTLIQPEYFEDVILIWYFQVITKYYNEFKDLPDQTVILNELGKSLRSKRIKVDDRDSYLEVFQRLWEPVAIDKYIEKEVIWFCRKQAVARSMEEVVDKIQGENTDDEEIWTGIIKSVKDAASVGSQRGGVGTRYFIETNERVLKRAKGEDVVTIPTGIPELDKHIGGGAKSKQLFIWLGTYGGGKSLALAHMGKRAVIEGVKVIHYTLELSETVIADRYDSSWTSIPMNELSVNPTMVANCVNELGSKYGDSLIIKEFPTNRASVLDLESHLTRIKNEFDFIPGMIIVDYGTLLKPSQVSKNDWLDVTRVYGDLRGLAGFYEVPVISACQVNGEGQKAEVITMSNMARAKEICGVADTIVSIMRTEQESHNEQARLYLAKNRNGTPFLEVPIYTNYRNMSFYNPSSVTGSLLNQNVPIMGRRSEQNQEVANQLDEIQ